MRWSLLALSALSVSVGITSLVACGDSTPAKNPVTSASADPSASSTAGANSASAPVDPPKVEKLAADKLDGDKKTFASKFADDYFKARNTKKFTDLGEESTATLRQALPAKKQVVAHSVITKLYGTYLSSKFEEAWSVPGETPVTVYRLRGKFSNGAPEIRVVLDNAGKVAGFFVRPWFDSIETPKPTKLDKPDAAQKTTAERVGKALLMNWQRGVYGALSANDFSEPVREGLTKEKQKESWEQIRGIGGAFKGMKFVEAWSVYVDEATPVIVYRFDGNFANTTPTSKAEVRVTLSPDGKVAGFIVKPWADGLE